MRRREGSPGERRRNGPRRDRSRSNQRRREPLAGSSLWWVVAVLVAVTPPGSIRRGGESVQALRASESSSEASEEVAPAGKVRCPDCDSKGRMKCPRCGGKGLLPRDCPTCGGTGRRPCTVCNEGGSGESPGRLVCPLCRGQGTVGEEGRTCSRCKGEQTVICTTCLGKGWHPCPKQIWDKVCPTCRFAGKIDCTTCGGALWITPGALASKKREATPVTPKPRAVRKNSSGDSEEEEEAKKEGSGDEDTEAVRARFQTVTSAYEEHYDVFADDLRPEIRDLNEKVENLERRLANAGAARELRVELDTWQKRAREFQKRWGDLNELFLKEHQTHKNARRVWQKRDEGLKELRGYRRELFEKQHRSRVSITTEIAETATQRLARFEPTTLLAEAQQLRMLWSEYEKRGEAELTLAAKIAAEEEARKLEAEAEAEAEAAAREAEERRRRETSPSPRRRTAERESRSARADPEPELSEMPREDPEKVVVRQEKRPPEPRAEGGSPLRTVIAVLLGFGAASCLFLLRGVWRSRNAG